MLFAVRALASLSQPYVPMLLADKLQGQPQARVQRSSRHSSGKLGHIACQPATHLSDCSPEFTSKASASRLQPTSPTRLQSTLRHRVTGVAETSTPRPTHYSF